MAVPVVEVVGVAAGTVTVGSVTVGSFGTATSTVVGPTVASTDFGNVAPSVSDDAVPPHARPLPGAKHTASANKHTNQERARITVRSFNDRSIPALTATPRAVVYSRRRSPFPAPSARVSQLEPQ
jgi:hypothetical protein